MSNISSSETIDSLAKALFARDPYTALHCRNVQNYARKVALKLKLSAPEIQNIEIGALLHDIGKIGTPENILLKPGKLSDEEFQSIMMHPTQGYDIISGIHELCIRGIDKSILHHHERFDGTGYPSRLKGEDIPLAARIISVCDAFDAMTTSRSYSPALSPEKALDQLRSNAGTQFDVMVVNAFIDCYQNRTIEIDPVMLKKISMTS
ncbi:HD-GYP domain-containing protein [Paenibacillus sp. CFBP13512]|uniref:HD-GYP domain-containing protein n=1 Tax=Paenibacillus sp. CFBP13512 TaxID=2184007 RepID=UPI001375C04F|nr:HD-GYP domain-containing protein [Paenibacillus sp. CFBP13512]